MQLDADSRHRFHTKYEKLKAEHCWVWHGTYSENYPVFQIKSQCLSAVKLAYRLFYKRDIPRGWIVQHICENPTCVNPHHLYLTTRSALVEQLYISGRKSTSAIQGSNNPNAKLTESDIRAIRQRIKTGASFRELGRQYGVSKTTISLIHHRKLWSHVA